MVFKNAFFALLSEVFRRIGSKNRVQKRVEKAQFRFRVDTPLMDFENEVS